MPPPPPPPPPPPSSPPVPGPPSPDGRAGRPAGTVGTDGTVRPGGADGPGADLGGEPVDPRAAEVRRRWLLAARIVLSAATLGVLLRKVDFSWSAAVPDWTAAHTAWLVLAGVLTAASIVLSAFRWQRVLVGMDDPVPLPRLTSHYFACQFVSNLLPTTIGGDVLRVARVSHDGPNTPDAFASVLLERLTGWLVLPAISMVGLLADPDLRQLGRATTVAVIVDVATLVGLVAILVAADHPRLGGRFAERQDWKRFVGAVHLGLGRLRRHRGRAVGVLAAGALYQLALVGAAVAAAQALGITGLSPWALVAFVPAVLMLQVLPISISGLGVREGAFVLFLTPLGVPAQQAVALGLLLWVLNLLVSLGGLPPFLRGGRAAVVAAPVPGGAA